VRLVCGPGVYAGVSGVLVRDLVCMWVCLVCLCGTCCVCGCVWCTCAGPGVYVGVSGVLVRDLVSVYAGATGVIVHGPGVYGGRMVGAGCGPVTPHLQAPRTESQLPGR
jgi:hypothetical protein